MMDLVTLQAYLGSAVEKINDDSLSEWDQDRAVIKSKYTANIAKQMINNADVILRADKLFNEGGLSNSSIMGLIYSDDTIDATLKK